MRKALLLAATLVFCAACQADESVAAYGGSENMWMLESIDGAPFAAQATLEFREDGAVGGQAPCNRWFGNQTAPYPWFALDAVGATRMACPELEAEGVFLAALQEMTLSEVTGDTLILSNDAGREMVFRAAG